MSKKSFADIQEHLHLFKGFYAQPRYVRDYATKTGGNILGYMGQITNYLLKKHPEYQREDKTGITGVEKVYEENLRGKKGVERRVVDVFGKYQGKFEKYKIT